MEESDARAVRRGRVLAGAAAGGRASMSFSLAVVVPVLAGYWVLTRAPFQTGCGDHARVSLPVFLRDPGMDVSRDRMGGRSGDGTVGSTGGVRILGGA